MILVDVFVILIVVVIVILIEFETDFGIVIENDIDYEKLVVIKQLISFHVKMILY